VTRTEPPSAARGRAGAPSTTLTQLAVDALARGLDDRHPNPRRVVAHAAVGASPADRARQAKPHQSLRGALYKNLVLPRSHSLEPATPSMPRFLQPHLLLLARLADCQLAAVVQYLKAENEILRARLPKRITVTPRELQRLLKYRGPLGLAINDLITIVSPRTFLRASWSRRTQRSRSVWPSTSVVRRCPRHPGS
jgi:hypothetical protein